MVLIETLWNVKFKFFSSPGERSFSFNRNIVECKGMERSGSDVKLSGF